MLRTLIPRKEAMQERSKRTVDAIVEATIILLNRDGLDNTSTNQIAERAGVSIGSLYQYFPNKESILKRVIDNEVEKQREMVNQFLAWGKELPLEESIDLLADHFIDLFMENRKVRSFIIKRILQYDFFEHIAHGEDLIQDMIIEFLKVKTKINDDKELYEVSFLLLHSSLGILRAGTLFDFRKIERSNLKNMLVTIFKNTLASYQYKYEQ